MYFIDSYIYILDIQSLCSLKRRQSIQFFSSFSKLLSFGIKVSTVLGSKSTNKKMISQNFNMPTPTQSNNIRSLKNYKKILQKQLQKTGKHITKDRLDIYFESQQFILNDACRFKIQYTYNNTNKTKMGLHLYQNKRIKDKNEKGCMTCRSRSRNKYSAQKTSQRIISTYQKSFVKVSSKIFELRRNSNRQIHEYTELLLTETQFFGKVYAYIGSVHLGWKLRSKNSVSLCQFISSSYGDKKVIQKQHIKISSEKKAIKYIKNSKIDDSILNFYWRNVVVAQNNYKLIMSKFSDKFKQNHSLIDLKFPKNPQNQAELRIYADQYYNTCFEDSDQIYLEILRQSQNLCNYNEYLLNMFYLQIHQTNITIFKNRCSSHMQRYLNKIYQACIDDWPSSQIQHLKAKRKQTKKQFIGRREGFLQQIQIFDENYKNWPLITYYGRSRKKLIKDGQKSMTFFVHGFQGNFYDLQKASNYFLIANQDTQIVIIKDINTKSEDLYSMGKYVAQEVKKQIIGCPYEVSHFNFVGYSLGGVIIRAALQYLEQYKNKFNLFFTLSSPHIGTSISSNTLVSAGVWYLSKVQKIKPMSQLHHQKQFLESLCSQTSLSWFRKIILTGSNQDQFIPFYSALVLPKLVDQNFIKQLGNKFNGLGKQIDRIQVWFDAKNRQKNIEKLIGKRSHLQFIDNNMFLQILFHLYAHEI